MEGENDYMKRIIIISLCIVVLLTCATGVANWLFGNPFGVRLDYNDCTAYSKQDVASAAQVIIDKLDSMEGCVLFSLKYAGNGDLEYCRSLNEKADYAECIVFKSAFRSSLKSYGAWIGNSLYTWDWHLARGNNGPWEIVTKGYA